MQKYLLSKDVDWMIVKKVLRNGSLKNMRVVNLLLITFSPLTEFCKICLHRYQILVCRLYNLKNIEKLVLVTKSVFWIKAIDNFKSSQSTIVFNGNHKGSNRKKLYILAIIFGYRWTLVGSERLEKISRRSRLINSELKIDMKKEYTIRELKRMKIDLPDMWIKTDKVNEHNKNLYIAASRGWYKRGIMYNTPGVLTFINV